ncbi:MAG: helix-turn-helix transcriptional regulator [Clostridia bacterium]|nr:helix-turn-helix transcriptional regulator [Clostridia bacterium]
MSIKLNEQIAFLRKTKGITQEELATALGVTNQAVSKWESAACCPDIMLLPDIARYFEVSIDELMGYKGADTSKDIALQLLSMVEEMEKGEDFRFTLKMAYILHAIIFTKENQFRDSENAIDHAGKQEWGYSCLNLPELTTLMHGDSVFFSANRDLKLSPDYRIRELCAMLKIFSDVHHMKTMYAIYDLTLHDENAYTDIESIAGKSGLRKNEVISCINDALFPYLREKNEADELRYRIKGMHMHIVPLLAMLMHP